MVEVNAEGKKILAQISAISLYQFIIVIAVVFGLLVFGGVSLTEYFDKSVFYTTITLASLVVIPIFGLVQYLVSIGRLSRKKWGWARLYYHNPAQSLLAAISPKILSRLTFSNILHIGMIFGLGLTLYGTISQTFFVGLPQEEFAVSKTGEFILDTEPASFSETVFLGTIMTLIFGVGTWILFLIGIDDLTAIVLMSVVIIVMVTLTWFAIHTGRYGLDQVAIGSVIVFGLIGSMLSVVTGSILPWYIWHFFNNLFQKATLTFSNEAVTLFIAIFLGAYSVIVLMYKVFKAFSQRSGQRAQVSPGVIAIGIVLIIISVVALSYFSLTQQTILFKSALTDEDFSIPSPVLLPGRPSNYCPDKIGSEGRYNCEDDVWIIERGASNNFGGSSNVQVLDGKLELSASNRISHQPFAIFKKDYKYRNFQFEGIFSFASGSNSYSIFFNDKVAYSEQLENPTRFDDSKEFFFQAVVDDFDKETYHILINGQDTGKKITITDPSLRLKFQVSTSEGNSLLRIDNVKSEPIFSCQISDDEIFFTDKFHSGSKVTLDSSKVGNDVVSLTHKPLAFCPEGNPVLRRDLDLGIRPEFFSSTFSKLVNGEIIEVPADEFMEVRYVVDFKEGQSDSNCQGESYSLNNKCIQVVTEKEDIIEVGKTTEFIPVGKNQKNFVDSIGIGDIAITSMKPSYLCADEDIKAFAPNPRDECWSVEIDYGGIDYSLQHRETVQLDEFFSLQYFAEAKFEDGKIQPDYKNNFLLTKTKEFLSVKDLGDELKEYYVLFGEKRQWCLTVTNNLALFDEEQSGFNIKRTTSLLVGEESYLIKQSFPQGTNQLCLDLNSNNFGKQTYKAIAYYNIGDEIFFHDTQLSRDFEVVNEVPQNTTLIPIPIVEEKNFFQRFIDWLVSLFTKGR